MRILIAHNYYQQRGGEDAVFETESRMLEDRGHEIVREVFSNDEIRSDYSIREWVKLATSAVWSPESAERIRNSVRRVKPDLVHFHNTFPLISPAAIKVCKTEGVPVVKTLHNYRLLCAKALLVRENQVCEDCLGRRWNWPGIVHACYRNSRSATAVVAGMQSAGWLRNVWTTDIDRFIALSDFGKKKFVEGGLPDHLISIKSNVLAPDPGFHSGTERQGIVFVGRLTPEKGIATMLQAWRQSPYLPPLRIIGDGPMAPTVRDAAETIPNIAWLGELDLDSVLSHLKSAEALLFPSLWYEGNPRSIIEALATGTPIIASRLGTMPEMITDGQSGLLFEPGNAQELIEHVRALTSRDHELWQRGARAEYLGKFGEEQNYARLIEIYQDVIDSRARRS